ncbi:MAG: prepilin-type N-terminal cleavage/methylation domain-containing protein [Holophagales bacterium]|nr:prepilin-type N-terminal cleavage/methylation domain-containing protein [Holophagales bacterium]
MFSVRPPARPLRRSPRRGVSLIELLVVLAVLLLIFAMGGILIGPPLRKARLASAANDLTVLAQRVPIEARTQRGGQGLFVYLKGDPAAGLFELIADTGGAGAGGDSAFSDPGSATDPDSVITTVQPVRLPEGIVFYDLPAPYDNCWSNWGVSGANFVLGVDFQGRTVGPGVPAAGLTPAVPGRQITGLASINLTHADMASGAVTPLVVHRITIGAVWGVRHTRLVRDVAEDGTFVWREF